MTQQEIYKLLTAAPGAPIQFIIETHYTDVLANALAVGLVREDVGAKALYAAVMNSAASPATFKTVMDVNLDPARFPVGGYEALLQAEAYWKAKASGQSQPVMLRSVTGGTGGSTSGSSTGGGIWNSDTTSAAVGTLPGLISSIGCLINPETCAQAPVIVGQSPTPTTQPPAAQTDYVPWIIGGLIFTVFAIVVTVIIIRYKK